LNESAKRKRGAVDETGFRRIDFHNGKRFFGKKGRRNLIQRLFEKKRRRDDGTGAAQQNRLRRETKKEAGRMERKGTTVRGGC